jgi:hypothetical protein
MCNIYSLFLAKISFLCRKLNVKVQNIIKLSKVTSNAIVKSYILLYYFWYITKNKGITWYKEE